MKASNLREKIRSLRKELRKEEDKKGDWYLVLKHPANNFLIIIINLVMGLATITTVADWSVTGFKTEAIIPIFIFLGAYLLFSGTWMLGSLDIRRLK